jgi:hypothetical protein
LWAAISFPSRTLFRVGDEAHVLDAGLTELVHRAHHGAVLGVLIGLDQDDALRFAVENVLDALAQLVLADGHAVDEEAALGVDGDDRLVLGFGLVGAIGCDGQLDVCALLQQRGHNHHDDEQHQHHVHERGHIDVGLDSAFCPADVHCHVGSP